MKKVDSLGDNHQSLAINLAGFVFKSLLMVMVYITAFEYLIHLIFPGITILWSHISGISTGILFVCYFAYKMQKLQQKTYTEKEEAKHLAVEAAVIAEIGQIISSTLNIDEVYELFALEVKKMISFDRLAVNLHSPHEENIKVAYIFGEAIPGRNKGESFPLKGSVSEVLTKTRAGLYRHSKNIEEMNRDFPNHVASIQAGLSSLLSVPLIYRDEVIGSLHFRSKTPNAYAERNLHLAEKIGTQIAGAIGNSQLFSQLKRTENYLRENEERIIYMAFHDSLTGLPNRRSFEDSFNKVLVSAQRHKRIFGVLMIDLNRLKEVNDRLGHENGDLLLKEVAAILSKGLRQEDFVARLGGDEFAILIPEITDLENGSLITSNIKKIFADLRVSSKEIEIKTSASVGLATYPKDGETYGDLMHVADMNMYEDKKQDNAR